MGPIKEKWVDLKKSVKLQYLDVAEIMLVVHERSKFEKSDQELMSFYASTMAAMLLLFIYPQS